VFLDSSLGDKRFCTRPLLRDVNEILLVLRTFWSALYRILKDLPFQHKWQEAYHSDRSTKGCNTTSVYIHLTQYFEDRKTK
jgi:hypothetical protein